jgi:hypothetical protein
VASTLLREIWPGHTFHRPLAWPNPDGAGGWWRYATNNRTVCSAVAKCYFPGADTKPLRHHASGQWFLYGL